MDWYRAMVKRIWWNGVENKHPCSHGKMARWWNVLVQIYGETNMVEWCTVYTPMFTWWNGDMEKWCGAENAKVKWCNVEMIILTFDRCQFLGPLQWWIPIPLLHFIGCCITHQCKIYLWMIPNWYSKLTMSWCNTLWCRIPLILSNLFPLFITLFIPPATANTGGVRPLLHLPDSHHGLLYLYW